MNPDMPFVEDDLQAVFIVGNTKAAKMRDVTMYLVQKTSYLMTQGLACAFSNMKKNDSRRDLIEALAGDTSVEYVFDVIRKGFLGHLLVHAQHAYLSSVNDHTQCMHQTGAFYQRNRHSGKDAGSKLLSAVESEVREQIRWDEDDTALQDGIKEGLKILSRHAVQPQVPFMIGSMVQDMKNKGIPNSEDDHLCTLLGKTAVVFAVLAPQFSNAVVMRCMSGLLGSLTATDYRHDYEESVLQELTKAFISGDLGERVKALQQREDELKEEYDDLCHALSKLRQLR